MFITTGYLIVCLGEFSVTALKYLCLFFEILSHILPSRSVFQNARLFRQNHNKKTLYFDMREWRVLNINNHKNRWISSGKDRETLLFLQYLTHAASDRKSNTKKLVCFQNVLVIPHILKQNYSVFQFKGQIIHVKM